MCFHPIHQSQHLVTGYISANPQSFLSKQGRIWGGAIRMLDRPPPPFYGENQRKLGKNRENFVKKREKWILCTPLSNILNTPLRRFFFIQISLLSLILTETVVLRFVVSFCCLINLLVYVHLDFKCLVWRYPVLLLCSVLLLSLDDFVCDNSWIHRRLMWMADFQFHLNYQGCLQWEFSSFAVDCASFFFTSNCLSARVVFCCSSRNSASISKATSLAFSSLIIIWIDDLELLLVLECDLELTVLLRAISERDLKLVFFLFCSSWHCFSSFAGSSDWSLFCGSSSSFSPYHLVVRSVVMSTSFNELVFSFPFSNLISESGASNCHFSWTLRNSL